MTRHGARYASGLSIGLLVASVIAWLWTTGNPMDYGGGAAPPGQRFYLASKLAGLAAMAIFWVQALSGLARRTPLLRPWFSLSQRAHRNLGLATIMLLVAHAALFITGVSTRSGHLAVGPLIPDLTAGFYKFYVSIGVLALASMLVVLLAGFLRRRWSIWRWAHRLWTVGFGLGVLHAVTIGTETRVGVMFYLYLTMAAALGIAVILWWAGASENALARAVRPGQRHQEEGS